MAVLNRVCANDVDTAVGRIVYTQWLDDRGGIIADVTVTRLAEDQYVVISGDNIHRRVPAWIRRQTRDGEFLTVTDVTSGNALLSVQGPRSRELLQRLSPDDWSDDAFPYLTAQKVELGYTPLWALRVTYVGELGWDLLVPTEFGATLYDQLREAGADLGLPPDRRRRAGDDAAGEGVPRHGPRHRLHRHPARGRARLRRRLGQARRLRRPRRAAEAARVRPADPAAGQRAARPRPTST